MSKQPNYPLIQYKNKQRCPPHQITAGENENQIDFDSYFGNNATILDTYKPAKHHC